MPAGCNSTCILAAKDCPPNCVQHWFAGDHLKYNRQAHGPPEKRLTWAEWCQQNDTNPDQALQFGSWQDADKVEQKFVLTNKQYRQAKSALEKEAKGAPHTIATQQPLLSVLDSPQRLKDNSKVIANDFCCLKVRRSWK